MDVGEARRVRDNRISDERLLRQRVRFDARPPAAFQHLSDHGSLLLDIASPQALHRRHQSGVLDHVGHELCRISTDRVELQARFPYKVGKGVMGGEANPVAVALKFVAEGDEGLNIASAADNLDNDIQSNPPVDLLGVGRRKFADGPVSPRLDRLSPRNENRESSAKLRVEVDVNTSVRCDGWLVGSEDGSRCPGKHHTSCPCCVVEYTLGGGSLLGISWRRIF